MNYEFCRLCLCIAVVVGGWVVADWLTVQVLMTAVLTSCSVCLWQERWIQRTSLLRLRLWRSFDTASWSSCTLCARRMSRSTLSLNWCSMAVCWSSSKVCLSLLLIHCLLLFHLRWSPVAPFRNRQTVCRGLWPMSAGLRCLVVECCSTVAQWHRAPHHCTVQHTTLALKALPRREPRA